MTEKQEMFIEKLLSIALNRDCAGELLLNERAQLDAFKSDEMTKRQASNFIDTLKSYLNFN